MANEDERSSYLEVIRQRGYGHVAQQLASAWLMPEAAGVFRALLLDHERGDRTGFPAEVYRAIMKLYTMYCFDRGEIEEWVNTYFDDEP